MSEYERLKQIVARLRAQDGCPWDRAQTHESLKPECIEEAAEVLSGINILSETGRFENLREELGDLLLQVVFHAQIAEEDGQFTLDDVFAAVSDKMIRRHPHVFSPEEVRAAWDRLEAESNGRPDGTAGAGAAGADSCAGAAGTGGNDSGVDPSCPAADVFDPGAAAAEAAGDGAAVRQVLTSWAEIKKKEKAGREWEAGWLPGAFTEAEALINAARKRKGF